MNYMITKKKWDSRSHTCGVFIPDGFTIVRELTQERIQQFEHLKAFGYNVEPTDLPEGAWDRQGNEVDYNSIRDHYLTRGNPPIKLAKTSRKVASKEVPKVVEDTSLGDDVAMMRATINAG